MISYDILFSLNFVFINVIIKTYIFIIFIQFIKKIISIIKKKNNKILEKKIPLNNEYRCPICLIEKNCNISCSGEHGKRHAICIECYKKLEKIICPICRGSMIIYEKSLHSLIIKEIINIINKVKKDIIVFIIVIFCSLCILDIIILFIEFIKYIF